MIAIPRTGAPLPAASISVAEQSDGYKTDAAVEFT